MKLSAQFAVVSFVLDMEVILIGSLIVGFVVFILLIELVCLILSWNL